MPPRPTGRGGMVFGGAIVPGATSVILNYTYLQT